MAQQPTRVRRSLTPQFKRVVLAILLASCASTPPSSSHKSTAARGHNVILITVDGLRNEELFGGVDERVLGSVEYSGLEYESESVRVRAAYGGSSPNVSRSALMPFFWTELVPNGVLLGNESSGGGVRVTNKELFSAPGYIEILTGEPHHDVVSNDLIRYPYPSFMEYAKHGLDSNPAHWVPGLLHQRLE